MKRALVVLIGSAIAFAAQASEGIEVDQDVLEQVKSIYGLNEQDAIKRLAAEAEAIDLHDRIKGLKLEAYAGAWFDAESLRLHVAINSSEPEKLLTKLGAVPVAVQWSLRELEQVRNRVEESAFSLLHEGALKTAFIDFKANRVVLGVASGSAGILHNALAGDADRIEIRETSDELELSADVRGGDGQRNYTFEQNPNGTGNYPCTIGVPTENGYYIAGHCGEAGNTIITPTGAALGIVGGSSYPFAAPPSTNLDIAWVDTVAGQTPIATINGYSDGLFNVPAKWAGTAVVTVGTTVCRYGKTSGGPHCGAVETLNFPIVITGLNRYIRDLVKVQNVCTDDGDSGGPWVLASDKRIVGTHTGGNFSGSCTNGGATYAVYQPIGYHIDAYAGSAGSILTAHGASAPTISGWLCPDPNYGSGGVFACSFDHYNSQGPTSYTWYLNNGAQAEQSTLFSDICIIDKLVRVKLTVTNDYGSTTQTAIFGCE